MYKCDVCQQIAPAGTKQSLIPVETRDRSYPHRYRANKVRRAGKKKATLRDDPGGSGFEIARQARACPSCHRRWLELIEEDARAEQEAA